MKRHLSTLIFLRILSCAMAQSNKDSVDTKIKTKNKFEIKVVPCKCDSLTDSTIISQQINFTRIENKATAMIVRFSDINHYVSHADGAQINGLKESFYYIFK